MKKLLLFTLFLMCFTVIKAQNIQILHGISSEKSYVNWATFELYKVLDKGPLYYFTDFKMSKNGYFESYSEISKYWYISRNRLALTAQYRFSNTARLFRRNIQSI
jgi:uncharacterized Fe-S radical SAM superfamily protein PflX